MKVAIIGAGACGLTSIKISLEEGLEPTCFEKSSDIAGLWRYTTTEEDHVSVYKSCVMVTSKEMSCFSDFPIPKEYPLYLPHALVKTYLDQYADNFKLREHVRLNSKVVKISRKQESGKDCWQVTFEKSTENGIETNTHDFDAVLVCSGHHWQPNIPRIPGDDGFKGEIIHSCSFKEAQRFAGKNVVVVGIGDSAVAIATELSHVTNKVHLSTRRGSWIISRLQAYGLPSDQFLQRRFFFDLPRMLLDWTSTKIANMNFDHEDFGLLPKNSFLQQPPVVNDYLPYKILSGALLIKPDILTLSERDVTFVDGSVVTNVDVIILATGYNFTFPFFDENMVEFEYNSPRMYKHMFRVEEEPRIAFIGCLQPVGCMFPVAELQARLATRVFKGTTKLPSVSDMEEDIARSFKIKERQSYNAKKHCTVVYYIPYCNSIAKMIGCQPRLGKMILSDPLLALRCYFGPCSPSQYRLQGPGAWDGARQAIMDVPERNIAQMRKKVNKKKWGKNFLIVIIGFLSIFIYYTICLV